MTRTNAAKHIELIKAFAEGKEIQYLNSSNVWVSCGNDLKLYLGTKYRVKPEPRELIIQVYANQKDPLTLHLMSALPPGDYSKPIRFREVID